MLFVNYKRSNVALAHTPEGKAFTFIPGINHIENNLWTDLLKNKHFKADFDAGHYKVESEDQSLPPNQGGAEDDAPLLGNVKASNDASRIIRETFDLKLLKEMRRNETRREYISLIDTQIQKIQSDRRSARGERNQDEDD